MKYKVIVTVHWALMILAVFGDLIIVISAIIKSNTGLEDNKLIILLTLPILIYVIALRFKKKAWLFFPWQHDRN